jgi:hypothetical protein
LTLVQLIDYLLVLYRIAPNYFPHTQLDNSDD